MLQRAAIYIFLLFTISLNSTYGMDVARYGDSLEREANKTTDVKKQVELLLAATKQLKFYDLERALSMANRALSLATNANMPELQLQAMIDVGNINTYKTQFTAGMEMALKAKEIASPLDLKNVLGEASLIIGMIKIFQADYGDSYEAYFEALRYFEQCNSQEGIVVALNGIGNICYYQRNFTKADIYYSQALKKAREIRDTFQIANVLNNVGLVLVERSQVEKAIGCYQEAIGIHKSLGLKLRLATNYINLSIAYLTMNRFDDFNSNYSMAFEIYASLGSRQNQAMCYLMYYDYCKQINDSENQLKYAMMAYGDGVKYNLRSVVSQAAEVLHEFYLSAGKIDSAYKYAMIWNAEKDSIDNEQATARLTLLEMEYTYDKQQKEANIKQQRKDFITIILIILGTSALITTILFLSRQIVKTKNIRLEKTAFVGCG
jgi:tetratricopeptide (TPR) repeat protein